MVVESNGGKEERNVSEGKLGGKRKRGERREGRESEGEGKGRGKGRGEDGANGRGEPREAFIRLH